MRQQESVAPRSLVQWRPSASGQARIGLARDYGIVVSFVVLFIVLSATTPNFLTKTNLLNILDQNAALGIIACGTTLVIIAGGFDLSVGAIFAASGVVAAWMAVHADPIAGLVLGFLLGGALGVFNGFLVSVVKVNSFLATLASALMMGGVALAVTGGFLIDASDSSVFTTLGRDTVGTVAYPVIVFVVVALVLGFVLSRTRFGRYVFAIGGNQEAARLSGVRVGLIRASTFVIGGLAAGLAGIIESSRAGTGQADVGGTLALDAIAAVVIGGTSILGGAGAMWRTVLGVLLLALIRNGFNILNIAPELQAIYTGAIIVVAVAMNSLAGRRTR